MIEVHEWMPREQWDALVRGENCPLCAAIQSKERDDEFGSTIADLDLSRLRLARNQFIPGYCVLICREHVREPYDLDPERRHIYFEDMMRSAVSLERVFKPLKMNFEILGNAVPHLHCHIKPRFYGDPAPNAPLQEEGRVCELTAEETDQRVANIREGLVAKTASSV